MYIYTRLHTSYYRVDTIILNFTVSIKEKEKAF